MPQPDIPGTLTDAMRTTPRGDAGWRWGPCKAQSPALLLSLGSAHRACGLCLSSRPRPQKSAVFPLIRRRSCWAVRRRLEQASPHQSGHARDSVYNRRESNPAQQGASLYLPLDAVNRYLALSGLVGEILFQWWSILQGICHSLVLHCKQYLCCVFLGCRKQLRGME